MTSLFSSVCEPELYYVCPDSRGWCIQRSSVCDGVRDCDEGGDELNCSSSDGTPFHCYHYMRHPHVFYVTFLRVFANCYL